MADGGATVRDRSGAPALARPLAPAAPGQPAVAPPPGPPVVLAQARVPDRRDDTATPRAPNAAGATTTLPALRPNGAGGITLAQAARITRDEDDDTIRTGIVPTGESVPAPDGVVTNGTTRVTPEVAGNIIRNIANGGPGFRPDLGRGGASWFLIEGNPHVGVDAAKNVQIPASLRMPANRLVFREAQLTEIFTRIRNSIDIPDAEERYRAFRAQQGNPIDDPILRGRNLAGFKRYLSQRAESEMWTEVGRQVAAHPSRAGEVVLEGSRFSRQGNGRFFLTADSADLQVRGGVPAVMRALDDAGARAEPGVLEAAQRLATQERWAGAVRGAFRVGGRVLLVVGAAADGYRIYTATDKARTITEVAGGWAGAAGASAAFAAWYTPADIAGPWAWLGHGVGTLAAGAVGYWAGSTITRTAYDLIVDQ